MSIILQDGLIIKGPYPADKKSVVGTLQEYASKESIPAEYRHMYMRVTDIDTGARYELQSDLTTWNLLIDVPSWVSTLQSSVTLSLFGGNLDWTRIDNAPTYTELDPVVFSATTLAPGSNATVTGTHPNFTLGIPEGVPGQPGPAGESIKGDAATITVGSVVTGASGSSVIIDNAGTANNAIFDFTIPKGDDGLAATLDVGTTTTGNAGSNALVTNSGTTTAATFNFVIPKGDKGDAGVDGSGVTILGSDTIANIVNKSGTAGDMWISTTIGTDDGSNDVAIGDGIVYDGADWLTVGPIRGPKGDTGDTGTTGDTGATGAVGADGLGWTGGSYAPVTGVVSFTSTDGLAFATGDLRGADGVDGDDGADGAGVPIGGTIGQLLYKDSATDYDVGWATPTYAYTYGSYSNYFQANHFRVSDQVKTISTQSGSLMFDAYDSDIGVALPDAESSHASGPVGLFIKNTQSTAATLWNTQHFGPINVNRWEDHANAAHAPANANDYTHPNHSGNITSSGDGATILQKSAILDRGEGFTINSADWMLMSSTPNAGVLQKISISRLESYMQSNLSFGGTYDHPNLTGQVDSVGTDLTALNVTSISAQPALALSILGTDQFLFNSRGALKKLDASVLASYISGTINFDQYLRSNANDTASGVIGFTNTTESTSITTGAVKITGGLGVSKTINATTLKSTGNLTVLGGSYVTGIGNFYDDVNVTGDVTAAYFYESSLRRLKENIEPFEKSALALISSLDIYTYDKKDGTAKDKIGIMVDESPKEFANLERTKVDLYKTIFIQAKAIQELNDKVELLTKIVLD